MPRRSFVCSLCTAHCDSRHDARASDLRRIGGTICLWWSGGVSAANQSRTAGLEVCRPDPQAFGTLRAEPGWRATRPLWIRLALLMLLTPLGILAAGTAWGEWAARDFRSADAAADHRCFGRRCPSASAAAGAGPAFLSVERALSAIRASLRAPSRLWLRDVGNVWQRPYPRILLVVELDRRRTRSRWVQDLTMTQAKRKSRGVVERSLASFVDALEHAFYAEELAKKRRPAAKARPSRKNCGAPAA